MKRLLGSRKCLYCRDGLERHGPGQEFCPVRHGNAAGPGRSQAGGASGPRWGRRSSLWPPYIPPGAAFLPHLGQP